MRILLDACVPRKLRDSLKGHSVVTAREAGLNRHIDGLLLDAAAGRFDAIVTVDKTIRFQQVLAGRPLALVVLHGASIKLDDLLPLVPALLAALQFIQPGEVREITAL